MMWAKVLLLDREPEEYVGLLCGLAKHGYEIHTATTVPRALALAGAHHYRAVLITPPFLDDRALRTGLCAESPGLSMIAVLPATPVDDLSPYAAEVVTHVIRKPLLPLTVQVILDRAVELAMLRVQVRQLRQAWHAPAEATTAESQSVNGTAVMPLTLEALVAGKLRSMVRHMGALGRGTIHRAVLSHIEGLLLRIVLEECRGNQVRAAEILGINRNTLRKKIRDFGLAVSR